tara:strand:- start:9475 stop:10038 length:564 start_codon:yes stop_codon:yes gene_type:complete
MSLQYTNQNDLLLNKFREYYADKDNMNKMISIINGQSAISLRIVDWFTTNYSKKYWVVYNIEHNGETVRFKVFDDYKLKLKAYSKKRFDPFCRWERVQFPYDNDRSIQTTIGQLNFFKWAIENKVIDYINNNYKDIDADMNLRNSVGKKKRIDSEPHMAEKKKRTELSLSAVKTIKKEDVEIQIVFH